MWHESQVSFANPIPRSSLSTKVGSFSVAGYPYSTGDNADGLQRLHEVDVTDAFWNSSSTNGFATLTFKLYSEVDSAGRVDFASKEWNGGWNQPVLIIELTDTAHPTPNPTTRPPTSTTTLVTPPVIPPSCSNYWVIAATVTETKSLVCSHVYVML